MYRGLLLFWVVVGVLQLAAGEVMADTTTDKLMLVEAPEESARQQFYFADAPTLSASTFNPGNFLWDTVDSVPLTFVDAGIFKSFSLRYLGYDPANRDRYEVSVYIANLEPDRVAPASGIAVQLAAQWGPINFGIASRDLRSGEVLGGNESSGEMIVSRISVWRQGYQVLIMRQKFEAAHFDTYAETIAQMAGSMRFDAPIVGDPVSENAVSGRIPLNGADVDFPMPANWRRLIDGANGTPMASQIWHDAADPNGNSAAMVMASPAQHVLERGERPNIASEQPMIDLAGTTSQLLIENLFPGATLDMKPRDMNSFERLDDLTAFNRHFAIDGQLNRETPIVIGVTIVMPADGTTLIAATLSPGALDPYLLGTQRHVDLVGALLLDAFEDYATDAAGQQGWLQ